MQGPWGARSPASLHPLHVPPCLVLPSPEQGQAGFPLFQGIVWPQVLSSLVGNFINALANYVLVLVLSLGVR